MQNINEVFEDKDFERLAELKKNYGYKSWRQFIIGAAENLINNYHVSDEAQRILINDHGNAFLGRGNKGRKAIVIGMED
jgi:hypothetical protein